ncbi:MAG: SpaA isopeptide-forming pilin-related protein [Clostridium sp.]|nr:SpaA isopeptide-forming pilin-related protein [Clostridium sp.]MCM1398502.1 SpaA isopeptide-forming pilin-related protein [Clostridium sp.]MCM1460224.1 SpaA isopeptide-forming pilin-related protein [Bacteroides sp.]
MKKGKALMGRIASFAVAAAMAVTSCLTGVTSKAAGSYKIAGRTPEQIMGSYGLTALDSIYINAHCHSNFLVKTLNNNANSGLNNAGQYQPYNESEEFYFSDYGDLNNSQLSNNEKLGWLYIGSAVTETGRRSNAVELKNSAGKAGEVSKPGPDHIIFDADADMPYADMDSIASLMKGYNQTIADMTDTNNVSVNFSDLNARTVTCPSGNSVAKLNADTLGAGKTSIVFSVDQTDATTSAVFNIDLTGKTEVNFDELVIAYGSRNNQIGNKESNATSNHNRIYYNFYDSSKTDKQYTGKINFNGRGFGTIIAPSADVSLGQNWDGIVVAGKVTISAEFHRIVNPIGAPKSEVEGDTANATLEFSKEESAGKELAGAKLSLTIASGDLSNVKTVSGSPITLSSDKKTVSWTSGTAPTKLADLIAGEYTWKETAAPNGYAYASDVKFKVDAAGKIYRYIGDGAYSNTPMGANEKLIMVDEAIAAEFSKQTKAGKELAGAKLSLTIGSGDLSNVKSVAGSAITLSSNKKTLSWTSGTEATVLEKLPAGEYTWKETAAPDGYEYATDVKFKIDTKGKIYKHTGSGYSTTPMADGEKLIMVDEAKKTATTEKDTPTTEKDTPTTEKDTPTTEKTPTTEQGDTEDNGQLLVIVYDEKTGDVVPGATVEITSPDGNSKSYKTNDDGEITVAKLPAGTYTVKTTEVPDGYDVSVGKEHKAKVVNGKKTTCEVYIVTKAADTTDTSTEGTDSSTDTTDGSTENTTGTNTNTNTKDKAVNTGDTFNIIILFGVMLCSAAGVVTLVIKKRKTDR